MTDTPTLDRLIHRLDLTLDDDDLYDTLADGERAAILTQRRHLNEQRAAIRYAGNIARLDPAVGRWAPPWSIEWVYALPNSGPLHNLAAAWVDDIVRTMPELPGYTSTGDRRGEDSHRGRQVRRARAATAE